MIGVSSKNMQIYLSFRVRLQQFFCTFFLFLFFLTSAFQVAIYACPEGNLQVTGTDGDLPQEKGNRSDLLGVCLMVVTAKSVWEPLHRRAAILSERIGMPELPGGHSLISPP